MTQNGENGKDKPNWFKMMKTELTSENGAKW